MRSRFKNMNAADRDRCEEEEAERVAVLFETVHARMVREYYEEGGTDPTYKPAYAEVQRQVDAALDQQEKLNQN